MEIDQSNIELLSDSDDSEMHEPCVEEAASGLMHYFVFLMKIQLLYKLSDSATTTIRSCYYSLF